MTEPPIACSLDQNALKARLVAAAEVGRVGLVSREQVGGRHLLRFRADPEIGARLEEIVDAERECCSFLSLTLEERGSELELRDRGAGRRRGDGGRARRRVHRFGSLIGGPGSAPANPAGGFFRQFKFWVLA